MFHIIDWQEKSPKLNPIFLRPEIHTQEESKIL